MYLVMDAECTPGEQFVELVGFEGDLGVGLGWGGRSRAQSQQGTVNNQHNYNLVRKVKLSEN